MATISDLVLALVHAGRACSPPDTQARGQDARPRPRPQDRHWQRHSSFVFPIQVWCPSDRQPPLLLSRLEY